MPTMSSTLRSSGRSLTDWDASASMATSPPSPWLSARSTKLTYLTDTMVVRVQKKMDKMPKTLSGVNGTWPEPNTSFMAYSTLVPISPYTTPMAPRVRAAREDFVDDTKNSLTGGQAPERRKCLFCACQPGVSPTMARQCCGATTNTFDLLVHLGFGVGGLEFVAGRQHGQTCDDAVHVKTVGHAGAGFDARLGQVSTLIESQWHKACTRRVEVFVNAALGGYTIEAADHVAVHHVDHWLGHRIIDALMGEHAFLNDHVAHFLTVLDDAHLVARLAVELVQVGDVTHGHDAHAIGPVVGLDHDKGLLVDAVFLVLALDLGEQRIHIAAQAFHAGALGKVDLAALVEHRVDQPGVDAQHLAKALGHFLVALVHAPLPSLISNIPKPAAAFVHCAFSTFTKTPSYISVFTCADVTNAKSGNGF